MFKEAVREMGDGERGRIGEGERGQGRSVRRALQGAVFVAEMGGRNQGGGGARTRHGKEDPGTRGCTH